MSKKKLLYPLLVLFFNLVFLQAFPAWLNFEPQTIRQPDGTIIECFATGDEFYNWLHDENGYTIIQNHGDGFYYYAVLVNGQLIPSAYLAKSVDPAAAGISPWTNISGAQMQAIRADFIKNNMPEAPQRPGYNSPGLNRNEGTLNNLVVYIRFSDQQEFNRDTMEYYNIFNNTEPGYNSMQNYFETVSYNMISIPSWFYPQPPEHKVISYQDIFPRSYFMPYDPVTNPNGYQQGQSGDREHALLKRAVEYIEAEVPETLNIDKNNDGYVDNMVFIIKGSTTAWATLLWPHRWALYGEDVFINGKQVWDYNLQVENHLAGSGAGVLCHEMFHSLSAPDLYHYNSAPFVSVGPWDLMDSNTNPPQSMGAYMKYEYGGWIANIPEITECGTYTLNPLSEPENNCFKIASPNSNSEYFVLEYRVKEGTFEGGLPGSGLLIYRIDDEEHGNAQGPPDEVYLYRPDGTLTSSGDLNSAHFGADYDRTVINDNTNPFPFLQYGGDGGLSIANVGWIGETISFDVYLEKEPIADFSASETLITEGCSIDFEDESLCLTESWQWTFEGGEPATSDEQNPQGVVFDEAGTHDVTLTVSNPWGTNTITKTAFIEVSATAAPQPSFYASDTAVCTGTILTLTDYTMVCPDSWAWEISPSTHEFVNGTNASSQNPEIRFNVAGPYSVSLTVGNANSAVTLQKENYILAGGTSIPFFEDFENGSPVDNGWTIINPDNDSKTWELFPVAGNGGDYAAGIEFFSYYSFGKRDQLISPPVDLSSTNDAVLTFEHAYALMQNPTYGDSLIVKISTDCGTSWERLLALKDDGSGNFATHEWMSDPFVPAVNDDWCSNGYGSDCFEVDISPWAGTSDVQVMFESVRMAGNNLYIDNVMIGMQVGEEEVNPLSSTLFDIYPNPSSGAFSISCEMLSREAEISIYNAQGKLIFNQVFDDIINQTINLVNQPRGLYLVHFLADNRKEIKKLIIN
jgi:M6 family metalloprotease-like protein